MEEQTLHELKYTSLACAHYAAGDSFGKLLAYVSLTPLLLVCFQASKVYCRREVHEAFILVGMVFNELVARTLKHLLKHPRPQTCHMLRLCHSYGMPSSHTSMVFFFLTTSILAYLRRPPRGHVLLAAWGAGELVALLVMAAAVAVSRVYLGYHSVQQVAAGAALGVVLASVWHVLLGVVHAKLCCLCQLHLCRVFGINDTWNTPEAQQHQKSVSAARKHQ